MFDLIAHSPLGFWIVALLIVVGDSCIFLTPGRMTFTFGTKLRVKIRVIEQPYLLKGREPVVTLLAYPLTPFFISSEEQSPQGRQHTKRNLLRHKRIACGSGSLSTIACVPLLLVCIIGPILSLEYGIERALITTLPAMYSVAACGIAILWANRGVYHLTRGDLLSIGFELMVCPVLLINVLKKIATRQPLICTQDLLDHFTTDRAGLTERLLRHAEATKP